LIFHELNTYTNEIQFAGWRVEDEGKVCDAICFEITLKKTILVLRAKQGRVDLK
jgi:hypothetical protein